MKKICVVTGTRAEYGLLRWVMEGINRSSVLQLQVVVTGMHLSPEFGLTYQEVEKDGFAINRKVEMLLSSDTPIGIGKSIGVGVMGFSDALAELQPDLLLLLGDRFEIFAAATAAMVARIPIAHLHGGETTEGAFDESIRHAITKMSHLHFVANNIYRNRVIQLGEQPENVHCVGGLGIDAIHQVTLLNRQLLEEALNFKFGKKNILVTFHPVTLENATSYGQMEQLLTALEQLLDTQIIFTLPNADTEGRALIKQINTFCAKHPNCKSFTSLGQQRYLSTIAQVDAVVGNSSSGLLEVPSFKKATVNIGDRQKGRLMADSVISCDPNSVSIQQAIETAYSPQFQQQLNKVVSPYGEAGASKKIVHILEGLLEFSLKKRFYDLDLAGVDA